MTNIVSPEALVSTVQHMSRHTCVEQALSRMDLKMRQSMATPTIMLQSRQYITPQKRGLSSSSARSFASSRSTLPDDTFDETDDEDEPPESPNSPISPLPSAGSVSPEPSHNSYKLLSRPKPSTNNNNTPEQLPLLRRRKADLAIDYPVSPLANRRRASADASTTRRKSAATKAARSTSLTSQDAVVAPHVRMPNHIKALGAGEVNVESSRSRAASLSTSKDFPSYGKPKPLQKINRDIRDRIVKHEKFDLKHGCVYMFATPEHPGYIKIGKTARGIDARKTELLKCMPALEQIPDSKYSDDFAHFGLVEALVHLSLYSKRKRWECNVCGKDAEKMSHKEFFLIDEAAAQRQIDLWRSWLLVQRPYTDGCVLTDYWKWRLQKLPAMYSNACWESWTQPPITDYWAFKLEKFCKHDYVDLKAHFGRKDSWFFLVGIILFLIANISHGRFGAFLTFMALCIL